MWPRLDHNRPLLGGLKITLPPTRVELERLLPMVGAPVDAVIVLYTAARTLQHIYNSKYVRVRQWYLLLIDLSRPYPRVIMSRERFALPTTDEPHALHYKNKLIALRARRRGLHASPFRSLAASDINTAVHILNLCAQTYILLYIF